MLRLLKTYSKYYLDGFLKSQTMERHGYESLRNTSPREESAKNDWNWRSKRLLVHRESEFSAQWILLSVSSPIKIANLDFIGRRVTLTNSKSLSFRGEDDTNILCWYCCLTSGRLVHVSSLRSNLWLILHVWSASWCTGNCKRIGIYTSLLLGLM
jgi:hypothetical protein